MGYKARILIVDDDPDIVEAMKVVLENKEYRVDTAKSGQEGLERVKLQKPDLVILDIMMETAGQGFNVARELKGDNNYMDIPILMLTAIKEVTGMGFEKEVGDDVWLPVDDYVEKPLKPAELISKVAFLLKATGKT